MNVIFSDSCGALNNTEKLPQKDKLKWLDYRRRNDRNGKKITLHWRIQVPGDIYQAVGTVIERKKCYTGLEKLALNTWGKHGSEVEEEGLDGRITAFYR